LAAAQGLTGCTVGPDYHRPDMPAPAAFAEVASTPRTQVLPTEADLSQWWTQFGDPVLDNLIAEALAGNPDLQVAASRVREARQQVREAAAAELPSVSASGNALTYNSQRKSSSGASTSSSSVTIPTSLNLYSAGFDATWEVDIFGGTRRAIEAARDTAEASEWSRRDGQVSLLAEVANDYLTLRALQTRIAVGEAELARQRSLFTLIQARRQSGFVTELDVNQQSVQVATAAAEIPQLEAQSRTMVHALGVLVGQPPEALSDALRAPAGEAALLPPAPPTLPIGLPSDLLRRRPDIREAERRLAAANAEIGVRQADLYPKINLLGMASLASTSTTNFFSANNFASAALGMLTQPVFDGGKNEAAIRAAKEEHTQALIRYRASILVAFRDVEDGLVRYEAEERRRTSLTQSLEAARRSERIAQDQYHAGFVTFINVLHAENAVLNTQDQLTQSDAQALSDLVAVYKALGGGWTEKG
jgi:NodT family efflux transporter outer membrane factor (OMF) lipoprotein